MWRCKFVLGFNTIMVILVLQAYCPMSLLNLGVWLLPLRHWGHKGVVGYPYCRIQSQVGFGYYNHSYFWAIVN